MSARYNTSGYHGPRTPRYRNGSAGLAISISLSSFLGFAIVTGLWSNLSWVGVMMGSLFILFVSLASFAFGYESAKDDYRVTDKAGRLYDSRE